MLCVRTQCVPRSKHYQFRLLETSLLVLYRTKVMWNTETQCENKVDFLNVKPYGK